MTKALPPGNGFADFRNSDRADWVRQAEAQPASIDLREILGILRRRWRLVFAFILLAVPFASYVWFSAETRYGATAVIRLGDVRRALTGGLVEDPAGGTGDAIASEIVVITSRLTALAVIDSAPEFRVRSDALPLSLVSDIQLTPDAPSDSLLLHFGQDAFTVTDARLPEPVHTPYDTSVEIEGVRFSVAARPPLETARLFVHDRETAASWLRGSLVVAGRRETDIIDIRYVDSDPARAVQGANRVAHTYQAINARKAQQEARLRREFMEAQLELSDSLLQEARQDLSAFRARRGVLSVGDSASSAQAGLAQILARRQEIATEQSLYQGYLAQLQATGLDGRREVLRSIVPGSGLADNPDVGALYSQMVQYEIELDAQTTTSSTDNPDVRRLRDLIGATETRLIGAVESALVNQLALGRARLATLDQYRLQAESAFRRFSSSEAEEARLLEQVEAVRTMSEQLRAEFQNAQLAEAVEVGQVEILELATAAAPIATGVARNIVLILLVGLMSGLSAALVAEKLNTAIRGERELVALGLPVLGVVPRLKERTDGAGSKVQAPIIEALRAIRLNMIHTHGTAGALLTTITSPDSRDGKSFIAANLAVAFASAGHETLLIDGDTRRGVQHGLMRAKRKPGLTDYLVGTAAEQEIIQKTAFPHLELIGCGSRTPGAPEHLGSKKMMDLMSRLRTVYRVVIVDSPPIGAGVDALTLGTATGTMVLVVRSGSTNRALAEAKLDVVERLPIQLLGVVANAVTDDDADQYSGYYIEGYDFQDEFGDEKRKLVAPAVSGDKKNRRTRVGNLWKHEV